MIQALHNLKKRIITDDNGTPREVKKVYIGSNKVWDIYSNDWYGIRWCEETDVIERIGNMDLHRILPLQSQMRRCMLNDDGTVYKYISNSNPLEYEDGTTAHYDGTDGQVMVEIPDYYHQSGHTTIDGKQWNYIKLYPSTHVGVYSRKYYMGAFELTQDSATNSTAKGSSVSVLDLTAMQIDSSTSIINASDVQYLSSASIYRNYNYNNTDITSVKCSYGRPRTGISRTVFRTVCKNRGTNWSQQSWDAYNSLLRLYFVEYANFNSQAAFNNTLTSKGYKQGGLGSGVINVSSTDWGNFNSSNSFIPCGITIGLGNNTGVIEYYFADGEWKDGSELTTHVPSYRGIENPFGHIWKFVDGFNRQGGENSTEKIYICSDINKFAESNAEGYELTSETAARSSGNVGGIVLDEAGTFWPKPGGYAIYSDYFYNAFSNGSWYSLAAGGSAIHGSGAGLLSFVASSATSYSHALVGGRLQYTNQ